MALILPHQRRILTGQLRTITPGNAVWGPGSATLSITIPDYNVLTMYIWGGGGGGGGNGYNLNQYVAGTAGASYFSAPDGVIYAYGGTGGYSGANSKSVGNGAAGSHGGASGGNIYNTTGGGMAGGAGAYANNSTPTYGGNGGYGGLVGRQWLFGAAGSPVVGGTYTLYLAPSGAGGYGEYATGAQGTYPQAQLVWS